MDASSRRQVPASFNIGFEVCGRWAEDRARFALYFEDEDGRSSAHTFWDIQREANRLANVLAALGTLRGDRVALLLPQCPEAAIAYVALAQMGAICVPLSSGLAPAALAYCLRDAAAHLAIVDANGASVLQRIGEHLPHLRHCIGVGVTTCAQIKAWSDVVEHASPRYRAVDTRASDPAAIIYQHPSPDDRPGAVMAHASLLGALSGYACAHDPFPQSGDLVWAAGDCDAGGGWADVLLPAWHFGVPVLAYRGRLPPQKVFALCEKYGVRNAFIAASALCALRQHAAQPRLGYDLDLRTIASVGGLLDGDTHAWCVDMLGASASQVFVHAAAKYVLGRRAALRPSKPGSIGRAFPGHVVALLGEHDEGVDIGKVGEIAIQRRTDGEDDPAIMSAYWQNPQASAPVRTVGGWLRTGDFAIADADGDLWPARSNSGAHARAYCG